jgi:hypothetical protein
VSAKQTRVPDDLYGEWRVERLSGFVPAFGLRKRINSSGGTTRLGPFPLAFFRVRGLTLDYLAWPVRDVLAPSEDGGWVGRGLFLGREFCRFRLVRPPEERARAEARSKLRRP